MARKRSGRSAARASAARRRRRARRACASPSASAGSRCLAVCRRVRPCGRRRRHAAGGERRGHRRRQARHRGRDERGRRRGCRYVGTGGGDDARLPCGTAPRAGVSAVLSAHSGCSAPLARAAWRPKGAASRGSAASGCGRRRSWPRARGRRPRRQASSCVAPSASRRAAYEAPLERGDCSSSSDGARGGEHAQVDRGAQQLTPPARALLLEQQLLLQLLLRQLADAARDVVDRLEARLLLEAHLLDPLQLVGAARDRLARRSPARATGPAARPAAAPRRRPPAGLVRRGAMPRRTNLQRRGRREPGSGVARRSARGVAPRR